MKNMLDELIGPPPLPPNPTLTELINYPGATAVIEHHRPKYLGCIPDINFCPAHLADGSRNPAFWEFMDLLASEEVHNVVTTVGRDFIHSQSYAASGLATSGQNYIALSNDTVTETSASTALSNEITVNGLARAQGTVAHTSGTNTTTVTYTFTCATSSQAAQKAALFTLSSSGVMNHVLGFTQRTLQVADTLTITFTITIG